MTEIKLGKGEFYIEEAGVVIARIQYSSNGKNENGKEIITVNHTIVNEEHSGKGLAKQLVNKIAQYAREENKLIVPVCSYAKKVLESNDENHDLLVK